VKSVSTIFGRLRAFLRQFFINTNQIPNKTN
jgi:hypothetical protein